MSNQELNDDSAWNILSCYLEKNHLRKLVRHQIESYNEFVTEQMAKTIDMFNPMIVQTDIDDVKKGTKQKVNIKIIFKNVCLYKPQIHENNGATKCMFPHEARIRNFTYSSNITVDISIEYNITIDEQTTKYTKMIPSITIGKIPIMLKSCLCLLTQYETLNHNVTSECRYDPGGYFIINGSEKTVIAQERAAENKVFVFDTSKLNTKWLYTAEIKSVPDYKCISPKHISMMISNKQNGFGYGIYIQIPRIKIPVPIFILFRALEIISDKDICKIILLHLNIENDLLHKNILLFLKASVVDANECLTHDDAMQYMIHQVAYTPMNMDKESGLRKRKEYLQDILKNDLFPQCETVIQKQYFLGYMSMRLLNAYFKIYETDSRDSYVNKRFDTTGMLLNNLFRNYFNKVVKDMGKQIMKEINNGSWRSTNDYINIINLTNIYKIIKSITIENGIKRALSTGDFGIKNINSNKVGVAQVLNRLTYISTISHLRRINTPIDKSGKLIPPRKLNLTCWGFLCPIETPEGQSIGVVKNLSYMTHITNSSYSQPIYDYLSKIGYILLEDMNEEDIRKYVKIIVNGCWIGCTLEPNIMYFELKDKKTKGILNIYTSIVFDYTRKEIRICNDAGRCCRPVFRVRDNKLLITKEIVEKIEKKELDWSDLLLNHKIEESVIEYIDAEEQYYSYISMYPSDLMKENNNYTYCEIHPSTIFGVLASCIPFPQHNQAPRLTYQCAMGKQAMGVYMTNFDERMDKTAYVLTYPSRPLVDTRLMNILKMNDMASGFQTIVAIMSYCGYNQEDSILVNKGSIDRGLFNATIYHTEKDEDKKIHGDEEIRCKPDKEKTKKMRFSNYDKLDENGNVSVNTFIEDRDIIIGKVIPIKENKNDNTKVIKYEDQSRCYRTEEDSYVDKVINDRNGDGYHSCKVRIRSMRKPVMGDKMSSRAAQKGTCGRVIPEADMPFTSSGLRPDLIMNPHAIPSRMTIGQLKETLLGKTLVELGMMGDGTGFTKLNMKTIRDELVKLGYESKGNEVMYNGETGQQMEVNIFIGPCYYQRLKHMTIDKAHSRSIGPMVLLSRQPAEGRCRDGGLRFGEMERDSMISHGAASFTKTRMLDSSDNFTVYVCKMCGMIPHLNKKLSIYVCKTCDNTTAFAKVSLPYSCKLMFHELMSINVVPRIITE